jgi:hypothetical protein
MVLHPERAGELFHLRAGPFKRRSRGDLAAIEVYVNDKRSRTAQSDELFEQEGENLFRAFRLKQTKDGGTARLGCTPSVDTGRLHADFGRSHAFSQVQALPPPAGCAWPGLNVFSFFDFLGAFSQRRAGNQTCETDSVSILEVSINGRDDYAGLYRNQVNADQRNADPGINDDAFVEYSIKNID